MSKLFPKSAISAFSISIILLAAGFTAQTRPLQRDSDSARFFAKLNPTLNEPAQSQSQPRQFSLADRIAYQYAIEEVYWRHRIWPKENPAPKPTLDEVMSATQIERKVEDYLHNSQLLADQWQRPITAEQLQAEMDRMTQHTKQPDVLRELFDALGNDPFVIAECLARPALAERLLTNSYAREQRIHGDLKKRAEADLRAHNSVEQMKETSGTYSKIELIKSDTARAAANRGTGHGMTLNSRQWDKAVRKLAALFDRPGAAKSTAAGAYETIPTGTLSGLHEGATCYYATAVLEKTKDRLELAIAQWLKEPLESWRARAESEVPDAMAVPSRNYSLPKFRDEPGNCIDDTWAALAGPPETRQFHTAVWTGSEMIVWGGTPDNATYLNTGGKYNPSTDSWSATSTTNAPSARSGHTAVWTGGEMIIWGGYGGSYSQSGGRYNPSTDSWSATSNTDAPSARSGHTTVWTGSDMIVWGGYPTTNTGGRYNPSTDSWTATSTINAPSARSTHTAVWTGKEMIVWGAASSNTGARYNPTTDSWTATTATNAPSPRGSHTAVWTGSEMIVWGGYLYGGPSCCYLNTGGRYNPVEDSWTATGTANAPSGRSSHVAEWTGTEMIIWGVDRTNYVFNGSRYNPTTDSWTAMSATNAPTVGRPAVWTGTEMIVWTGGIYNGGRYNPSTDTWTDAGTSNAPNAREGDIAVWTGSEMIIWGGVNYGDMYVDLNTGGRYNPATDSWMVTTTSNAPSGRTGHTAVWTGIEMIVWGGIDSTGESNSGGRYNPTADSWTATSTANAANARVHHTGVWTGSEMIVWGGYGCGGNCNFNIGGRYNPTSDSWTATSTENAPVARWDHTAVWTGNEMIVWGGTDQMNYVHTGGRYIPATDRWTPTGLLNVTRGRIGHTAVWTGTEMIVWGGIDEFFSVTNTGGRYNPMSDSWVFTNGGLQPRYGHSAVWTGSEMIIWGGYPTTNTGGRYNPAGDSWILTTTANAPLAREDHTAVWTGSEMIVWGGSNGNDLNTGGRYCAQLSTPIVQSAVSQKNHFSAGTFDVNLPLTGMPGIECRTGGTTNDYTVLVAFSTNVIVNGNPQAAVTSGIGTIGGGGLSNGGMVFVSGHVVMVPLTNVANAQTIQISLNGVNGSNNIVIPMSVLVGDTNSNGAVNASDVSQTKGRIGQTIDPTNFRSDVNVNGAINAGDVSQIKLLLGTGLPGNIGTALP